jgi:hypothetical protein
VKRLGWDIATVATFTVIVILTYTMWGYFHKPWMFYASAVAVAAVLALMLAGVWRLLNLWLTQFFCIVSAFDLLAEGFLQPFRDIPADCWKCQMTMFWVFAIYMLVLRPVEKLLRTQKTQELHHER